jgi:hypothetical protein
MGPAKIKRWLEKRGVAIKGVSEMTVAGTPIVLGYQITAKNGNKAKLEAKARPHDLENLRRKLAKV